MSIISASKDRASYLADAMGVVFLPSSPLAPLGDYGVDYAVAPDSSDAPHLLSLGTHQSRRFDRAVLLCKDERNRTEGKIRQSQRRRWPIDLPASKE